MREFEPFSDRDAYLEGVIIRQACRASNKQARRDSDVAWGLAIGLLALLGCVSAIVALVAF